MHDLTQPILFSRTAEILSFLLEIVPSHKVGTEEQSARNVVEDLCGRLADCLNKAAVDPAPVGLIDISECRDGIRFVWSAFQSSAKMLGWLNDPHVQRKRSFFESKAPKQATHKTIAYLRLETVNAHGQLNHPKALLAEIDFIQAVVTPFKHDHQATQILQAMAQAANQATLSGAVFAAVAYKPKSHLADSPFECSAFCAADEQDLSYRKDGFGREWSFADLRLRTLDAHSAAMT